MWTSNFCRTSSNRQCPDGWTAEWTVWFIALATWKCARTSFKLLSSDSTTAGAFLVCECCCPLCELAPCDSSVTLPSFLLFSNPSCTGQHTARASISAPSPAYLSDTQVGTAPPTEPFGSPLATISFPSPYVLVFLIILFTELVFCCQMASIIIQEHVSHVGGFHPCWHSDLLWTVWALVVCVYVCCQSFHASCLFVVCYLYLISLLQCNKPKLQCRWEYKEKWKNKTPKYSKIHLD